MLPTREPRREVVLPAERLPSDVELQRLTKRFADFTAVDDLELEVRKGEFISLLGPSGCGKTTTLNLIAGFEEPTSGEVLVAGHSMAGVPPYRRDVNTVFQSYALFPHMNVLENVGYGLKQRKVDGGERRRRAAATLELVGLSGRERARPAELSGGQQQRVALARALVLQPRVLLLDEPLGALDLKLRRTMQIELKRIQRDVGVTFVFVTHDQDEAMTMSDRIAVMHAGRIEHLDAPADVYDRPATPFVAGFIGEMNTITGTLVRRGERGWRARLADGSFVDGSVEVQGAPEGAPVALGIRPERLRVREHGDGLPAVLMTTMVVGDQLQRVVRLQATGDELVAREPRHSDAGDLLTETTPAVVYWPRDAISLLGPSDGHRLVADTPFEEEDRCETTETSTSWRHARRSSRSGGS